MADCAYTKIAIMQLFYELKQKFPSIPDQVVSDLMQQVAYNKEECEKRLSQEYRNYHPHSYPSNIVDKMTEGKERPKTLSLGTGSSGLFRRARDPLAAATADRTGMPNRKTTAAASQKTEAAAAAAAAAACGGSDDSRRPPLLNGDARLPEPDESVQNFEICSQGGPELLVRDVRLQFQNDASGRGQTRLRIQYERDSQSAPTTPCAKPIDCCEAGVRRHRSVLNVDRTVKSPVAGSADCGRPRTGVKMTMRPPSAEPLPPIKISTDGGANLIYMTTSSGAASGYRNQLQISIAEDGNTTISASRTRNASNIPEPKAAEAAGQCVDNGGVPDLLTAFDSLSTTSELRLREQVERKKRLEAELERERESLAQKQLEVKAMEEDLERRKRAPIVSERVIILRAEVAALSDECRRMEELISQALHNPRIPTSENNNNDSANWTCRMCTFKNHPTLPKCEQCEMARVDLRNVRTMISRPQFTVSPGVALGAPSRQSGLHGGLQFQF